MYMRDKYFFLSNFYPCDVYYRGLHFNSAEAAFQSQKCPERMNEFAHLKALQAKRLGRKVQLRLDWENVKIGIMYEVVYSKFRNETLANMLVNVDEPIVEHNNHNDRFWGVCRGKGSNYLGIILTRVRDEIMINRGQPISLHIDFSTAPESIKRVMCITKEDF